MRKQGTIGANDRARHWHKLIGLIVLLPLLGWVTTGAVFLLKPGYDGAYEQLKIKTYPMQRPLNLAWIKGWQEVRVVKSILGYHLLVSDDQRCHQLDAMALTPRPLPDIDAQLRLMQDAISHAPQRYGNLVELTETGYLTSTGVQLTLDWDCLGISQIGSDTTLINNLYRIHYLQWSPWDTTNRFLAFAGLALLLLLCAFGLYLFVRRTESRN